MGETATSTLSTVPRVHYDEPLWREAREFTERRTLSALAKQLNYSSSLISRYVSRTLENPENVEESLRAWRIRRERHASGKKFAWTEAAGKIVAACQYAARFKAMVPIAGRSGIGKTTALLQMLERGMGGTNGSSGKQRFVFVTCSSYTSGRSLTMKILAQLGVKSFNKGTDQLLDEIVGELVNRPHLIIVDDASHLPVKALEALRYIYDRVACGVILIGTKTLLARKLKATGREAEDLEQFTSRLAPPPEIPTALSKKDVEKVARTRIEDLTEREVDVLARRPRTARNVHWIIDQVEYLKEFNKGVTRLQLLEKVEKELFEVA